MLKTPYPNSGLNRLQELAYIDGCRSIDHIHYSLIAPVNRQKQSDGYECRFLPGGF